MFYETFDIYSTQKVVKIRSRILKSIFICCSLLVGLYVIVYAIWFNGGYQRQCPVRSSTISKIEGALVLDLFVNDDDAGISSSNANQIQRIWDGSDVAISPSSGTDSGSFFILTNFALFLNQTQGICPSAPPLRLNSMIRNQNNLRPKSMRARIRHSRRRNAIRNIELDTRCKSDPDCAAGRILPSGVTTGKCVQTATSENIKTCEIVGWCPQEPVNFPLQQNRAILEGTRDFVVVLDIDNEFPICGPEFRRRNYHNYSSLEYATYLQSCIYNPRSEKDKYCPRIRLGDAVTLAGGNYSEVSLTGGVFIIRINWNCTFDWGYTIKDCLPVYSFHIGNEAQQSLLNIGSSFQTIAIVSENTRNARRNIGLRFLVEARGGGRIFDFLTLSMTVGAGSGLLGLVVKLCDSLLDIFCKIKDSFQWNWLKRYDRSMKYEFLEDA